MGNCKVSKHLKTIKLVCFFFVGLPYVHKVGSRISQAGGAHIGDSALTTDITATNEEHCSLGEHYSVDFVFSFW